MQKFRYAIAHGDRLAALEIGIEATVCVALESNPMGANHACRHSLVLESLLDGIRGHDRLGKKALKKQLKKQLKRPLKKQLQKQSN